MTKETTIKIGDIFGKLVVIQRLKSGWLCECECGNEVVFWTSRVKYSKSCGCKQKRSETNIEKIQDMLAKELHQTRMSMGKLSTAIGLSRVMVGYILAINGTKITEKTEEKIMAYFKAKKEQKKNAKPGIG